jgi:hypothetical protein
MKNLKRFGDFIVETVNITIADQPLEEELENIHDIAWFLRRKIYYDFASSFDEAVKEQISEALRSDAITPDGGEHFKEVGTLNFYTVRYPKDLIPNTLSYIKYILKEHNIEIGETRTDREDEKTAVIRIPVISNEAVEEDPAPMVNLSNSNAKFIFCEILNMDEEYHNGSCSVYELMIKVKLAVVNLHKHPEQSSYSQTKSNIYTPVNGQDYIKHVLKRLEELATWANENGYISINIA